MNTLGKTLTGLALIAATATQCSQPVRARRDYGAFPQYRKSIALHNIQQILGSSGVCSKGGGADEVGLGCNDSICASYGRNIVGSSQCENYSINNVYCKWEDVTTVDLVEIDTAQISGYCLKLSCSDGLICRGNKELAEELKEAIEIYLQERSK